MSTAPRHLEFAPPPTPGFMRALGLAILAHGVLLAILTVGVQWKHEPIQQRFEAELWSTVPVEAAPPAPLPVPETPRPVAPEPKPEPKPQPKPEPEPPPAAIKAQADIALQKEKEKAKLLQEKKLALEKAELEKKKLVELEKQKQAQLEEKQAKLEREKKDKLDKQKKEQADKLAREKDDQQRKQDAKETANLAKTREDQLTRMARLAGGGNGSASSLGTAGQAAAPSASYAGRIVARIRPNITYPDRDSITGNPRTEVDIRTGPSGTILSARITQSSGIKSWDEAVLRAIDKTEVLPKDVDGTVQPSMLIGFKPKD